MKKMTCMLGVAVFIFFGPLSAEEVIKGYSFNGNGYDDTFPCFEEDFQKRPINNISLKVSANFEKAIKQQLERLDQRIKKQLNPADVDIQITTTLRKLVDLIENKDQSVELGGFDYSLSGGEDGCGNTLLTGYFTPTIKLKRKPDQKYRYPFYRKPAHWPGGKALTREQIDSQHLLAGQGLEIGYSDNQLERYLVHVQGSTNVHFIDSNERISLSFASKNGHPYKSLGKYLTAQGYISKKDISLLAIKDFFAKHPEKTEAMLNLNPSYVFFQESEPTTSSGTPPVAFATAAVDPKVIPLGSLLLVEYPGLDEQGKLVSRTLLPIIASDTGSAIKGLGHLDLYLGDDEQKASQLHHYGRVWKVDTKEI